MDTDRQSKQDEVSRLLLEQRNRNFAFILAIVRDYTEAEDIFQETSLTVLKQWDDFKLGTNFGAWFRQIARNKIMSTRKKQARMCVCLTPEAIASLDQAADDSPPYQQYLLDALQDCIGKLKDKGRNIIRWRYEQGLDTCSIARKLNSNSSAVYMALSRIRSRLSDCVQLALQREYS